MREQEADHEIRVIDLSAKDTPYSDIVEAVFSNDRVISW